MIQHSYSYGENWFAIFKHCLRGITLGVSPLWGINSRTLHALLFFSIIINLTVNCPIGYYLNSSKKECQECPKGFYQDSEAQVECKSCPLGMSTVEKRSQNSSDCKGNERIVRIVSNIAVFLDCYIFILIGFLKVPSYQTSAQSSKLQK